MIEDDLLRRIFQQDEPKWAGKFPICWCDTCDTYSMGCTEESCHGSSCNGGGCEVCMPEQAKFHATKPSPIQHLNDVEQSVVRKYYRLKKLLGECLEEHGTGLDWDWLYYNGRLCDEDWNSFENLASNYTPYDIATKEHPEKFPYLS